MGLLKSLEEFIELANAARVDIGSPATIASLLTVPGGKMPEVSILAERLKGTAFYLRGTGPALMLARYSRARQVRDVLLQIAESGRLIQLRKDAERRGVVFLSRISAGSMPTPLAGCPLRTSLPMTRVQRVAVINSDGRIGTEHVQSSFEARFFNRFADALDNLNAATLRECPHCHRIFQARRHDAVYCSNNCRQGHWRTGNPEKVAVIQNRYEEKRERRSAPKIEKETRTGPSVKIGARKRRRAARLPGSIPKRRIRKIVTRIVT